MFPTWFKYSDTVSFIAHNLLICAALLRLTCHIGGIGAIKLRVIDPLENISHNKLK